MLSTRFGYGRPALRARAFALAFCAGVIALRFGFGFGFFLFHGGVFRLFISISTLLERLCRVALSNCVNGRKTTCVVSRLRCLS